MSYPRTFLFRIHCQSREYWAGGGDGGDSLLGLVVGVMGLLLAVPLTAFIKRSRIEKTYGCNHCVKLAAVRSSPQVQTL